jgi:fumarate hydratase class II
MKSQSTRTETDALGPVSLPMEALYGASTYRALENFGVSGITIPEQFITTLGIIKKACAFANVELGTLDQKSGKLIAEVAQEIADGNLQEHFPLDVFQTGSGTSTNMNINEVIANKCSLLSGKPVGSKKPVHPNDHVNLGQSSNDVMPTALHVSVCLALRDELAPALSLLEQTLNGKADEFRGVIKLGRTHLMDAIPMSLREEFSGFARQTVKARERCLRGIEILAELAIGGTAVGNGRNTDVKFGSVVCRILSEITGLKFKEAENHFEAQASRDDAVEVAGQLAAVAACLTKIANDIRLLGSGPRGGLAELKLPPTQPGSSIMPGKVNPVMSEMLVQVCHYSIGLCQTVTRCGQDGHLQLNATIPLIAYSLLNSIKVMSRATRNFSERCVSGLEVDAGRCRAFAESSIGLATALAPHIGYDKASEVAKKAHQEGKSVKQAALELAFLDETVLDSFIQGWLCDEEEHRLIDESLHGSARRPELRRNC